jgi:hypothetical protein
MKTALAIFILVAGQWGRAFADESWQDAFSRMPLGPGITELNRTNGIASILNAFQSNNVVKALVLTPGAADDFVFYRRAHATLTNASPSLLDAVVALTNQTYIRAEFRPPLLLLYTTEDSLGPVAAIKNKATAARLMARTVPGRIVLCDCNWDNVRPAMRRKLSVGLRPFPDAPDSWHFWPSNFAACGLTQWDLLEAIARSSRTTFTLHWLTADYTTDNRAGPVQNLNTFPELQY